MIELEHVSKAYRTKAGAKTILADVSVRFPRGRSVGVMGVNGAGKSTLLRLIAGIDDTFEGEIVRPQTIAMVFQKGYMYKDIVLRPAKTQVVHNN